MTNSCPLRLISVAVLVGDSMPPNGSANKPLLILSRYSDEINSPTLKSPERSSGLSVGLELSFDPTGITAPGSNVIVYGLITPSSCAV